MESQKGYRETGQNGYHWWVKSVIWVGSGVRRRMGLERVKAKPTESGKKCVAAPLFPFFMPYNIPYNTTLLLGSWGLRSCPLVMFTLLSETRSLTGLDLTKWA